MRRSIASAFVLLVVLGACSDAPSGPSSSAQPVADVPPAGVVEDRGPPPPRTFGPDTWRTGIFTGRAVTQPGLTCDDGASGVRRCSGYLASAVDSARLDVTLQIPTSAAPPIPLVVVVHGYGGSKSSSNDVVVPLLEEGYAVLRYSTRGFGHSWGQVNLVDTHAEVPDMRSMIAQVVDGGYGIDGSRVAVTGASYGGGHSWMAALQPTFSTPAGGTVTIRTIVPIAAWSDLLYSLLPSGSERESVDRLGGAKLSYINGLYLSGVRRDPERPYLNYPLYFIGWHAWINVAEPNTYDPLYRRIRDGLAGYRSIWWQQRFWSQAAASRLPVFGVQGFTDDLFPLPEAKRMVNALQSIDPGYPVAAYLGDIGHPRASNKPEEIDYVLELIRSWLGYHLKGVGSAPSGIHAALTRPREEVFTPGNVITAPTIDALATRTVSKTFALPAVLVNPLTDPAGGFFWDPLVMEGARELQPLPVAPESPLVPGSLATYDVPVAELSAGVALTIAGQPTVSFRAVTSAWRVQLNVRLFEIDGGGVKRLITRGTYTAQGGAPGVPVGAVDVTIPTYGNLWRAEPGSLLRLELTNVDSPYLAPSRVPSSTVVSGVRLEMPVRD